MSIRKIRKAWWVDFRIERVRYRKRSPDNSAAGARAYELLLRQRLARGEALEPRLTPPELTFAAFVPKWFEAHVVVNNKVSEQKSKATILRLYLVPWFGPMRLSAIRSLEIERFKSAQLARGVSAKTVNNYLTVLRCCLRCAVEWEFLDHIPRVKLLHVLPPERDFLTIEEGVKLVEAAATPMWRAMILLALRTGMRLGELCGLEWGCINMELGVITVRQSIVRGVVSSPKNHRQRFVPFPHSVAEALRSLPRAGTLVFSSADGGPLAHVTAERAIHQACRRAGLRLVGWHTLRHSCASQLGMLRGTLLEAQRLLGHSSLEMTERYTHIVPAILHQAVNDLDMAAAKVDARATGGQQPPSMRPGQQGRELASALG